MIKEKLNDLLFNTAVGLGLVNFDCTHKDVLKLLNGGVDFYEAIAGGLELEFPMTANEYKLHLYVQETIQEIDKKN